MVDGLLKFGEVLAPFFAAGRKSLNVRQHWGERTFIPICISVSIPVAVSSVVLALSCRSHWCWYKGSCRYLCSAQGLRAHEKCACNVDKITFFKKETMLENQSLLVLKNSVSYDEGEYL